MFQKQASWKQKCSPILLCCISSYHCLNSDLIITKTNYFIWRTACGYVVKPEIFCNCY